MSVLGLTSRQCEVVKKLQLGFDYAEISRELMITEQSVVEEEMIAMAILSRRWRKSEIEVRDMLKGLLLIFLSLLPIVEGFKVERALKIKTSSSKVIRSKRQEIDDFAILDV